MTEAPVRRIGEHALLLTGESLLLLLQCLFEPQRLEAASQLMLVLRICAPDRVTKHHDEPRIRELLAIHTGASGWNT